MNITQLNHVALHVTDLEASRRFYADVLGLQPIPRPAFDFPGAWFRLGVDQELHLIAGGKEGSVPAARRGHYALMVDSMAAAEANLKSRGVPFRGPKPRPDGAQQIFLADPDGYAIELCTPVPAS